MNRGKSASINNISDTYDSSVIYLICYLYHITSLDMTSFSRQICSFFSHKLNHLSFMTLFLATQSKIGFSCLLLSLFWCVSQLAAEHQHRYRKELTAPDMPTSLDLFNEDVYASMDSNGHIVRKDMFKGIRFVPCYWYCRVIFCDV